MSVNENNSRFWHIDFLFEHLYNLYLTKIWILWLLCQSLYTYNNLFLLLFFQVIDFGSSCYEHQRVYTYIQSRFYRAPEVILGARYGMPIDMWSLGCILAELLTGYPLLPGEDEGDQLSCIIELLGMPPQKLLDQSKRAKNFISSKGKYSILSSLWIDFPEFMKSYVEKNNTVLKVKLTPKLLSLLMREWLVLFKSSSSNTEVGVIFLDSCAKNKNKFK